jgi:hypothetical protein
MIPTAAATPAPAEAAAAASADESSAAEGERLRSRCERDAKHQDCHTDGSFTANPASQWIVH